MLRVLCAMIGAILLCALVALIAYDRLVVRPQLLSVRETASSRANPPELVCRLIEESSGPTERQVVRLTLAGVYPTSSQGVSHLREALWGVLLPIHLDTQEMCEIYSALQFNGLDRGLGHLAMREYGRGLHELTPTEAAKVVVIARAPSFYRRDRVKLSERAQDLLSRLESTPSKAH